MRATTLLSIVFSLAVIGGVTGCDDKGTGDTSDGTVDETTPGTTDDTGEPPTGDDTGEPPTDDTGGETGETGDTGPVTELIEDCTDGSDNDGDGLADCEDDDCVDFCMEDCTDGIDNDGDGAIDCDDDECFADPVCPTIYDMELRTRYEALAVGFGPGMVTYTGGDYLAGIAYGVVQVVGTPQDTAAEGFLCEGQLYADSYSGFYPGAMTIDTGDTGSCDGCDYRITMDVNLANYSLEWRDPSSCPIEALPLASLGMRFNEAYITRYIGGSWVEQYTTDPSNTYYQARYPGTPRAITVFSLSDLRASSPYAWSAAYEL